MLEKIEKKFKTIKENVFRFSKNIEHDVALNTKLGLLNNSFGLSIKELINSVKGLKDKWNTWEAPWIDPEKKEAWKSIYNDIFVCNNCDLDNIRNSKSRLKVPGAFTLDKKGLPVLVVSESPGYYEETTSWNMYDKTFGYPFMGKAGKIFESMVESINIDRFDLFITNVLKCSDKTEEVKTLVTDVKVCYQMCSTYIYKQMDLFKPIIVWTLGTTAHEFVEKCLLYYNDGPVRKKTINYGNNKQIVVLPSCILINNSHPAYISRKGEDHWFLSKEKVTLDIIKMLIKMFKSKEDL